MKKLLLLAMILVGGTALVIYLMPEEYRKNPRLLAAEICKLMEQYAPDD
jgi:uncharacterized protein YneF (UPF0154 family)